MSAIAANLAQFRPAVKVGGARKCGKTVRNTTVRAQAIKEPALNTKKSEEVGSFTYASDHSR